MSEVVGAEAEELGRLRNFVGGQRPSRHFNHGANEIAELDLFFRHHFLRHAMDDFDLQVELPLEAHQRNHDFGLHFDALLLHFGRGFKNSTGLHFRNLRIHQSQAAAAEAQHGIEFVEFFDALRNSVHAQAKLLCQQILRGVIVGQEFVQRRIEEADGGRQTLEFLENAHKIFALIRE